MSRARRGRTLALATALVLAACAPEPRVLHLAGPTMGATYEIKVVCVPASLAAAEAIVASELARFDGAFSTWRDDSAISAFNAHLSTEPFEVPAPHRALFLAVLRLALEVAERSGGALDPTIEPMAALLGFSRQEGSTPSDAERAAALARVGWRKLRILDDGRVCKSQPDVAITLNSMAPGAAADAISDALAAAGMGASMVDIGGEIRCRGTKPDGVPWQIGIERPTPPGAESVVQVIAPLEGGLATSGDYRKFRFVDGEVVHHILDPRTGRNVRHAWASVSVWADAAGLADALATACMVLGPDGATPMLESYAGRGVHALFLSAPDAEGRVTERRIGRD